jgi:hypothetical protein
MPPPRPSTRGSFSTGCMDKVPIEELQRLGLWRPEVNLTAQGLGGSGKVGPGGAMIPVLTPGSSRPQFTTTAEEAKGMDAALADVERREAAVLHAQEEAKREGSAAPSVSAIIADPGNYEAGADGRAPVVGAGGVERAPPSNASSSSSSSRAPAAVRLTPRPVYRAYPPGTGKKRDEAVREMRDRGEIPMQSNEVRDAIMKAISKKRGAAKPAGGETQTALNKKFKAAWTAAGKSGQTDAIIRELGELGVFDGPGGSTFSEVIAERIAGSAPLSRNACSRPFSQNWGSKPPI